MRKVLGTLGLLAVVAMPGSLALAAGHGQHGHGDKGQAVGWQRGHARSQQWQSSSEHGKNRHGVGGKHDQRKRHDVRQFEGVVASYDGTSLVLHPRGVVAIAVTVGISSSTVITAEDGMSATLAMGEQVHVACVVNPDGSLTALRVDIQRSEAPPAGTPWAESHGADSTPVAGSHDEDSTPVAGSHDDSPPVAGAHGGDSTPVADADGDDGPPGAGEHTGDRTPVPGAGA